MQSLEILLSHSIRSSPREIAFSAEVEGDAGNLLVNLLTDDHSHADANGRHNLLLEPYGYRWYRVGGLDYLLKRSDIDIEQQRPRGRR